MLHASMNHGACLHLKQLLCIIVHTHVLCQKCVHSLIASCAATHHCCMRTLAAYTLTDHVCQDAFKLQVAEATAAAGSFVHKEDVEEEGFQVQSLRDYAVAIPTMNAIHGQDSWRAQHVSEEYGDHSAWDVRTIVEILGKFFNISQGTSLPELAEYNWRLDKVTTCDCF